MEKPHIPRREMTECPPRNDPRCCKLFVYEYVSSLIQTLRLPKVTARESVYEEY